MNSAPESTLSDGRPQEEERNVNSSVIVISFGNYTNLSSPFHECSRPVIGREKK